MWVNRSNDLVPGHVGAGAIQLENGSTRKTKSKIAEGGGCLSGGPDSQSSARVNQRLVLQYISGGRAG